MAPLCSRHPEDFQLPDTPTGNVLDLFVSHAEHESSELALDTCNTCRIVEPDTFTACARAALVAGTTLDGVLEACASGVIQAGIECRGDLTTWRQLKHAAGETLDDDDCDVCGRSFLTEVSGNRRGVCAGCARVISRHDGVVAPSTARNEQPPECLDCHLPMTRDPGRLDEGWVRHAARGLCRRCDRKARRVQAA